MPGRRSRCTSSGCATSARSRAFTQLAAQLGYLRLSGYRLALERAGLRSKLNVVNPATGAIVAAIPDVTAAAVRRRGHRGARCWPRRARCRPPVRPRTRSNPELLRSGPARAGAARRVDRRGRGRRARRPRSRARERRARARSARGARGGQAAGRLAGAHVSPTGRRSDGMTAARSSGASRARTGDLVNAIHALSQLSYSPGESELAPRLIHARRRSRVATRWLTRK